MQPIKIGKKPWINTFLKKTSIISFHLSHGWATRKNSRPRWFIFPSGGGQCGHQGFQQEYKERPCSMLPKPCGVGVYMKNCRHACQLKASKRNGSVIHVTLSVDTEGVMKYSTLLCVWLVNQWNLNGTLKYSFLKLAFTNRRVDGIIPRSYHIYRFWGWRSSKKIHVQPLVVRSVQFTRDSSNRTRSGDHANQTKSNVHQLHFLPGDGFENHSI